jgi:hypothetical protein
MESPGSAHSATLQAAGKLQMPATRSSGQYIYQEILPVVIM